MNRKSGDYIEPEGLNSESRAGPLGSRPEDILSRPSPSTHSRKVTWEVQRICLQCLSLASKICVDRLSVAAILPPITLKIPVLS